MFRFNFFDSPEKILAVCAALVLEKIIYLYIYSFPSHWNKICSIQLYN